MQPGGDWSLLPGDQRKWLPRLCQGSFKLDIRKKSQGKGCKALKQDVQGSGGVTTPGSVQKTCGCSMWGCGLVLSVVVLG